MGVTLGLLKHKSVRPVPPSWGPLPVSSFQEPSEHAGMAFRGLTVVEYIRFKSFDWLRELLSDRPLMALKARVLLHNPPGDRFILCMFREVEDYC